MGPTNDSTSNQLWIPLAILDEKVQALQTKIAGIRAGPKGTMERQDHRGTLRHRRKRRQCRPEGKNGGNGAKGEDGVIKGEDVCVSPPRIGSKQSKESKVSLRIVMPTIILRGLQCPRSEVMEVRFPIVLTAEVTL
jgi:hypothetical protein